MAKFSPLMILPPAIFASFVLLAAVGMFRDDPNSLPSARVGHPSPPVVLSVLGDKSPFDDAALRDGQLKLVNFWASWCAPCRVEHPNLKMLRDEGIPLYGVNYKDDPAKALTFLQELGDPYSALGADTAGRMALDWGVYGVPETYLIDGDGKILLRIAGPMTERVLAKTLRPAIKAAGG